MAAQQHKRSELFSRRHWVALAREYSRELKSENTKRLHQDKTWTAKLFSEEANLKRSETMSARLRTDGGKDHLAKMWSGSATESARSKKAVASKNAWAKDDGSRKAAVAERSRALAKDPAWIESLARGENHPRRKNPEKWAEAERAFKENNPMRDPAVKARAIEAHRNNWKDPETRARLLAVSKDPARREKIRAAKLGTKLSEEHKEKVRQANLGKKLSAEHRAKIGVSSRKQVQCVETGTTYPSCKAAAEEMGVHPATLSGAISNGWKCKGLTFIRL
jgi:hypothetical protein